jgi:chromosome segregation ATPase
MGNGNDNKMKAEIARIEKKIDGLDKKVDGLDKKVDGLDKKVDGLDKKVDDLANSTKMQFEAIREDIKKLGEGCESGMKKMSRQFQNLAKKWTEQWSTHDAVLKNHNERITTLERHHANRGDQ